MDSTEMQAWREEHQDEMRRWREQRQEAGVALQVLVVDDEPGIRRGSDVAEPSSESAQGKESDVGCEVDEEVCRCPSAFLSPGHAAEDPHIARSSVSRALEYGPAMAP